jgi:cytochrome c oxidase assembly protein subunit 15
MPFVADYRTLGLLILVVAVAAAVSARSVLRLGHGVHDPRAANLARVAWLLSGLTWFLLVFGSSVRVNGAGLACPDWPACFGQVIPQLDWAVFLEFGHRVVAGVVSLVFVGLAVAVLRDRTYRSEFGFWFAVGAVVLATQVVLGGLTVLHLLAEWTVSGHLLVGNTFSATLGLIAIRLSDRARPVERPAVDSSQRLWSSSFALLLAAQLVVGGLVSSGHAGLACPDWPSCNAGDYFPGWSGAAALQTLHRVAAYALIIGAVSGVVGSRGNSRLQRFAWAALALVAAQATLGVANVLLRLPVEVTLLHSAGAAALVLTAAWWNHEAWSSPLAAPSTLGSGAGVRAPAAGWTERVGQESP